MAETWKAFVVNQTETEYIIISERDKKYHTLPLPIEIGDIRLPDGSIVSIQDTIFTPDKLFTACKNYQYDLERKRRQYKKKST